VEEPVIAFPDQPRAQIDKAAIKGSRLGLYSVYLS